MAAQIQSYANINDAKSIYESLVIVYVPIRFSLHPVRRFDGVLIKNEELILAKWAEYLQNLLNQVHITDPGFLDNLLTLSIIPNHDDLPSFDVMEKAILSLKDNKTADPDNLPVEVIKFCCCALHRRLHNFILDCWSAKCLPQQWKISTLFFHTSKRKTEQNVASVVASLFSQKQAKCFVDPVLPEIQGGFRRGCNTIDMIYVVRQLMENSREQHQDIYMAFVDLLAFETVNRNLLWNIPRKFGCPPTFIAILRQFHTGMCAQVVMAGSQPSNFPVEVGVEQSCVLAPIVFNLLIVAITLVSLRDLQSSDCAGIEYRLGGGFFTLRRIQGKTKTSSAVTFSLQYADDAANPSLTADGLQRSLDIMSVAYLCAGLMINAMKTEILSASSPDVPTFSISGNLLKNSRNFAYLGSNLSFSGDLSNEIQRRIDLASLAIGCLSKRVFGNQHLTILTRIALYDAAVICTILYGCET